MNKNLVKNLLIFVFLSTAFLSNNVYGNGSESTAVLSNNENGNGSSEPTAVLSSNVNGNDPDYKYEYDINGRLISIANKLKKIAMEYDSNGNLLSKKEVCLGELESPDGTNEVLYRGKENYYIFKVKGWFLDKQGGQGVKSVSTHVDGIFKSYIPYGVVREDIYNNYPSFNNHNSGYSADLSVPVPALPGQLHKKTYTITVKIVSLSGDEYEFSKKLTVVKAGIFD